MFDAIFYFFAILGAIVFTAYFTYSLVRDIKDDMRRKKALNDFLAGKRPPKPKEDEDDE